MAVKLNSTGGGSVTLDSPSTASNYTVTLPSAAGTLATTTGTGSVFTNPTINGFTGDTSAITIGTTQFVKDASGNVGLGTIPTYKLHVLTATNNYGLYITDGTYSGGLIPSSATGGLILYNGVAQPLGFWTNNTERMRLDASGNLGLGVTPSAWSGIGSAIELKGNAYIASTTQVLSLCTNAYFNGTNFIYKSSSFANRYDTVFGEHRWLTAASGTAGNAISFTQAMTLDASGNLLVGTTTQTLSSVANFYKTATGTNQRVASFINNGTPGVYSPAGLIVSYPNAAGGNGSTFLQCADGTTDRLYILGSGNVQNTNNSYGAISDISVKENIVDATPKLNDLLKVKIRSFNLKGENVKQIGVVAQELEEIFPGMIEENDNGLKGVKYSVFVPMLVKAIQELSAQNNALEARLAQLEAK